MQTHIYRFLAGEDHQVGYIDGDGVIHRLRWGAGVPIGRVEQEGARWRIFRNVRFGERELGYVDEEGVVHSHGLIQGGEMGWLDPDGVVVLGGLILGEEEIGRVEGPLARAAAGALLLVFYPEA
ncbi:MAG: hypothetical protein D6790_08460 [Caldilineae bacterium]|nr:MAG: hypothetical protein D6790_08460 [Caldilineae bacterium]